MTAGKHLLVCDDASIHVPASKLPGPGGTSPASGCKLHIPDPDDDYDDDHDDGNGDDVHETE